MNNWQNIAIQAALDPHMLGSCPQCAKHAVRTEWAVIDVKSRDADFDLTCGSCGAAGKLRLALPEGAPYFFPSERGKEMFAAVQEEIERIATRVRKHASAMPAAAFTTHPLWAEAGWNATTFQWHPTSAAPPIMGLVFENSVAGKEIFREAERQMNHEDRFEEIRVSIIEGMAPGEEHRPGYSVHICADPEALAAHATAEDFVVDPSVVPFLGQWNRHYPIPGMPALLPRFKMEFAKHKEFLLAPVIRRDDGKLYTDHTLGIIKNVVHFRDLSEITGSDDPDAAALVLPQFITPPR